MYLPTEPNDILTVALALAVTPSPGRPSAVGDRSGVSGTARARMCAVSGCTKPAERRQRMCSMHRSRFLKYGDTSTAKLYRQSAGVSPEEVTRQHFLAKLDRSAGEDACWRWLGSHDRKGYGRFKPCGETVPIGAHQYAFQLFVGPVPADRPDLDHVCHTMDETCPGGPACPHRGCVNPRHLEPVTRDENSRRGRNVIWQRRARALASSPSSRLSAVGGLDADDGGAQGRRVGEVLDRYKPLQPFDGGES